MRIWYGKNGVYDGDDNIIGFRCDCCDRVVPTMFGDWCNKCVEHERRHKEIVNALSIKDPK